MLFIFLILFSISSSLQASTTFELRAIYQDLLSTLPGFNPAEASMEEIESILEQLSVALAAK